MADSLLDQIERDALDENASVATALRKCVALGGRSGSETLRDWAARELDGYEGGDPLPDYRVVAAVIQLDGMAGNNWVTGQTVLRVALGGPTGEVRRWIGAVESRPMPARSWKQVWKRPTAAERSRPV
ncbi:MAG TPA: hypothetical protein VK501_21915 [Baekduia sp.]|uniref:AbiTii domain-containing protein n=1 Tax=Baekduia sp. TaxID=2600305 RepID=UPI002BF24754|nr:hypothetical protein [Baekduia sp.]HMJ36577.1 hypothetical protein [Baekduia sp.]